MIHVSKALELADKATFTQEELDAYQKVIDEIQQVRDLAEAKWAEGEAAGAIKTMAAAILAVLKARGIGIDSETRAHIMACSDPATLERWLTRAATADSAGSVIDPAPSRI